MCGIVSSAEQSKLGVENRERRGNHREVKEIKISSY
jgi:hypothetical protein